MATDLGNRNLNKPEASYALAFPANCRFAVADGGGCVRSPGRLDDEAVETGGSWAVEPTKPERPWNGKAMLGHVHHNSFGQWGCRG